MSNDYKLLKIKRKDVPEINFRSNTILEVYAQLDADINELYEIGGVWLERECEDRLNEPINREKIYLNDTIRG